MVDKIKVFLTNLFRKTTVRILVGLILVLLTVSSLLRALTPQPVPSETIISNTQIHKPKINFNSITVDIPKQMNVYRNLDDKKVKSDELADQFIRNLNLSQKTSLPIWRNEEATIVLEKNSKNEISMAFFNEKGELPKTGIPENKAAALSNIQNWLVKLGYTENTQISEPQFMFMESHIVPVPNREAANSMLFKVNILVDGLPLMSGDTTQAPAEFWTDLEGNVLKAGFYPVSKNLEKIETNYTLSLAQIEQQIKLENVTFLNVISKEDLEGTTDKLSTATFERAQLEYRKNEQNGYIIPYVHFYGTGLDGAETFDVEVISPAMKVE